MSNHTLKRWQVGHQLFFLFIQSAMLALHNAEQYLAQRNLSAGSKSLRHAANMMKSSSLAMKYGGDFPQVDYENIIRPSMPDRFSGMGSMDHANLVKIMAGIRKNKQAMQDFFGEEYKNFVLSVQQAYDAHIYVCERFMNDKPSLRSSEFHPGAPQVLAEFKCKRLSYLQPK